MKKMVWIRFSEHADRAKELLEPYGLRVNDRTWIQKVDMAVDDERLEPFTEGLRRRGISYTEMRYFAFDKKDLRAAEYLHVSGDAMWGYPQPEDDYESESYDSSTKCSKCGQGAEQNRPFLVKNRPSFGKNDIVAMFWTYEFLVTQRLKDLVEAAGLSGAEFWPLVRYKEGGSSQHIQGAYQAVHPKRASSHVCSYEV